MLLILAIIATSMVAPVHEGEVDFDYPAYMMGRVDWDSNPNYAVVTVTGGNFTGTQTLYRPGDYRICLGFPANETIFTVTCALIFDNPPHPVITRTGIEYPGDFTLILPDGYWVHYENFLW